MTSSNTASWWDVFAGPSPACTLLVTIQTTKDLPCIVSEGLRGILSHLKRHAAGRELVAVLVCKGTAKGLLTESVTLHRSTNRSGGDTRIKLSKLLPAPPPGFTALKAHKLASLDGE